MFPANLEDTWREYTKPVVLEDEVLGTLTLNREFSTFDGVCKWMDNEIRISLDVEVEKKASWTRVRNVMKKLLAEQASWDKLLREMAALKLTPLANEWLADNDHPTETRKTTPLPRMNLPGASESPNFLFLPAVVSRRGSRMTTCSGAM